MMLNSLPTVLHPRALALQRFADGEAPDAERGRVASHLERCARCRATVAVTRSLARDARDLAAPAAPAELIDRVLRDRAAGQRIILPNIGATVSHSPLRRRGSMAGLAAAALLLAILVTRRDEPAALRRVAGVGGEDSLPTLRGTLLSAGMLTSVAYGQDRPASAGRLPPIAMARSESVRPLRMTYELTYRRDGRLTGPAARGETVIERATWGSTPAWRVSSRWEGRAPGAPETTYVKRGSFRPLYRIARQVGPSHYTVIQHFSGDSLLGVMRNAKRSRPIARALPTERGPFIAGDGTAVVLLQAAAVGAGWRGSASIVGWGAAPSDLIYPLELRQISDERVTVPAGTFDCWKIAITDGRRVQDVWIRKTDRLTVMSRDSTRTPGILQQVVLLSTGEIP
ncbi:MAG: zf-HC2 domain-containing protein [Gemmatimonadota bacterium]|nr:zf-HC2 domain-containing protein [Gemmatimonadota bacterium]